MTRGQLFGNVIVPAHLIARMPRPGRRRLRYGEARRYRDANLTAYELADSPERGVAGTLYTSWRFVARAYGRLPGPRTRNPRAARYICSCEDAGVIRRAQWRLALFGDVAYRASCARYLRWYREAVASGLIDPNTPSGRFRWPVR